MNTSTTRNTKRAKKARSSTPNQARALEPARPGGKLGLIVDCIAKGTGATAHELAEATGWQKHSVLGALSRLRTRGFAMRLESNGDRKAYRLDRAAG